MNHAPMLTPSLALVWWSVIILAVIGLSAWVIRTWLLMRDDGDEQDWIGQ